VATLAARGAASPEQQMKDSSVTETQPLLGCAVAANQLLHELERGEGLSGWQISVGSRQNKGQRQVC